MRVVTLVAIHYYREDFTMESPDYSNLLPPAPPAETAWYRDKKKSVQLKNNVEILEALVASEIVYFSNAAIPKMVKLYNENPDLFVGKVLRKTRNPNVFGVFELEVIGDN